MMPTTSSFSAPHSTHAADALSFPKERFAAGTVIIREGEEPGAVYVITQGCVRVTHDDRTLAVMGTDGIFGDMALIDHSPRSATVTALEDTECFKIDVHAYQQLLGTAHPLLRAIIKILTARLRQMTVKPH